MPAARGVSLFLPVGSSAGSGTIISANGGFLTRRFPCGTGRRRTGKIIGKRITQTSKSVAKNGRKKYGKKADYLTQEPFFITPIWRAISMNIRGGWLTIINVVRTMTAWPGASGSIPTVDR